MSSYAIQRCCTTPVFLKQYETSTDAVLRALGVDVVDIKEFNCCGYPLKNVNFEAHVLLSARNLALAKNAGLDIVTFCNCCYGNLRHVRHQLKTDADLRARTDRTLHREGLECPQDIQVKHLLDVLLEDVGIGEIEKKMSRSFEGLKVAVHYGCHLLRPRQIAGFDNALAPTKLDRLVEMTGAESVAWSTKLDCCGSPVWGVDDPLSMDLTATKLKDASHAGAECLCTACPYCQLQFDKVQKRIQEVRGTNHALPALLFTQILGLCLGLDAAELGIEENAVNASGIAARLA